VLDDERRILTEIEDRLRMADPAFVARMTAPDRLRFPAVSALLVVFLIAAPVITVQFGAAVLGLTAAAVLTGIVIIALSRHARPRRRRPPG
jgi:hypothetical protein